MKRSIRLLGLLVFTILACSLPGSPTAGPGDPDGDEPLELEAVRQASPEVEQFVTGTGEPVEVTATPPDALAVARVLIEEGGRDRNETLIHLLQIFVQERPTTSLFGDLDVHLDSGWGLTMWMAEVYPSMTDTDHIAEVDRLMRKMAPTREMLDAYAMPEDEFTQLTPNLRARPARQSVPCVSISDEGFPDPVDERPTCLLYRSFSAGGHEYRVYYPTERRGDAGFMTKVDVAFSALKDSQRVLSKFGELGDVNLIFTLLNSSLGWHIRASVPAMDQSLIAIGCPISVYPSAVDLSDDKLRWVIAHESFHCITMLQKGVINYDITKWYVEGMATYFANVVYPDNNLEHMFMDSFHSRSVNESIVELDYDAFSFFQHLANQTDPESVMALHNVLPGTGSDSDQIAVLSAVPDIQDIFHGYGRAYFTGQIADTGGGTLPGPTILLFNPEDQYQIGEGRLVALAAEPFVLARFLMEFRSGYEYTIEKEESGSAGRNGWRDVSAAAFVEIPETETIACEDPWQYQVLLTSAESGGTTELSLDFTSEEEDRLDCCLVGNWEQQTSELSSNLETTLAGGATLLSLTGNLVTVLTEDHEIIFYPRNYSGVVQFEDDEPPATFIVTGINTGRYSVPADGRVRVTDNAPAFVVTIITSEGTVSTPLGPEALGSGPMTADGTFGYVCSETTLTASTEGLAPFPDSTFQRVSEIPMTPMPEEIAPPSGEGGGPPDIGGAGSGCMLLTVSDFSTTADTARWTIANGTPEDVAANAISMDWPPENGDLTTLMWGTALIWSGAESLGPAFLPASSLGDLEDRGLGAESFIDFSAQFSSSELALSGYVLVVEFSNGCILSDFK
jgi:hypothetical protein